ncbi:MAG: hypothetical protein Aurels2KO_32980 [Aureliella sp.]
MILTVQLVHNCHRGLPVDAYDCACELLEGGFDAPILQKMIFLGNGALFVREDLYELLDLIDRPDLLNHADLRRAMEASLNRVYLDGKIDARSLIQQCCDLYWDDVQPDHHASRFWCSVADDAAQHGGEGCIKFPFNTEDFDVVLRTAIEEHGRPVMCRGDSGTR